jgi:hypothetical protein
MEEDFDDEPVTRGDAVIDAWRENSRRMIFLAHPDRGGNEELAKLLIGINDIVEGRPEPPSQRPSDESREYAGALCWSAGLPVASSLTTRRLPPRMGCSAGLGGTVSPVKD